MSTKVDFDVYVNVQLTIKKNIESDKDLDEFYDKHREKIAKIVADKIKDGKFSCESITWADYKLS